MNDLTRRGFILTGATVAAYGLLIGVQRACRFALADNKPAKNDSGPVQIVKFADDGARLGVETVAKVVKSDADWRHSLSSDEFDVTRKADTERAFSGALLQESRTRPLSVRLLRKRALQLRYEIRFRHRLAELLGAHR